MENESNVVQVTRKLLAGLPSEFPERIGALRWVTETFEARFQELTERSDVRIEIEGSET